MSVMQCRINHCAVCTAAGGGNNCHFYHAVLTYERWENVHSPQFSCRPTYIMTTFVLLSSALCLECDNRSYLTVDTARQHVCRELSTSAPHATSFSLAALQHPRLSANSWTATRVMKTVTYTRCRRSDLTCLSMDVRDCIRYQDALKHFIHLRSSSKRL